MKLVFTKMHGLGNDFVVVDATRQALALTAAQVRQIADRRFGVGCDQILLVEAPPTADVLFGYRIFNADGSEVHQCGNGARCFAKFVVDKKLTQQTEIPVRTRAGRMVLTVLANGLVCVNMGAPNFTPAQIPLLVAQEALHYSLEVRGQTVQFGAVSMGNPHAVLRVDSVDSAPVAELGPALESHPAFPQRVNVGFLQVENRHHARLRVYERGTGETLACGSAACAAAALAMRWGELADEATVCLPGGELHIAWAGPGQPLWMTGPAQTVFEGEIEL